MAFAVQGVLEVEHDRLDTMIRMLAPMMGAKIKDDSTAREKRHRGVLEDQRQRRAATDQRVKRAIMEDTLASLANMGFEVEVTGPVRAPGKGPKG